MINTIILGHALNVLPKLPAESVSCVTTSPPYWSLRDYGIEPVIWDGDKDCKHIWEKEKGKKNIGRDDGFYGGKSGFGEMDNKQKTPIDSDFCQLCSAWRGSLGLEPTFELYIKHLCDIFDEVKRILRKDGTCFVNIGDTYASSPAGNKEIKYSGDGVYGRLMKRHTQGGTSEVTYKPKKYSVPNKSLCDIPYRFSIEMTNRGWIKRNTIIWHKPNCMPSSADDRFTIDFEYLFYFTKNNKTLFWTNEKTLECVDKKPLGTKGIEGVDWEWRETQDWKEEENAGYEIGATDPHRAASIGGLKLGVKHKKSGKLKKASLWSGHDYWFEQQFEPSIDPESYSGRRKRNESKINIIGGFPAGDRDHFHKITAGSTYPNRNKRCVWIIPTQPFPEAHFAVYPDGLIEIPIKAGCPEFVCKKCGKARVKILDNSERVNTRPGLDTGNMKSGKDIDPNKELHKSDLSKYRQQIKYKEVGYSDCGCNAGFESGIVLDPFMGAGTSALVALKQRKRFIGIEIKQEYIDMAYRRIAKVQQRIF